MMRATLTDQRFDSATERHFELDPEVKGLTKELRAREWSIGLWIGCAVWVLFVACFTVMVVVHSIELSREFSVVVMIGLLGAIFGIVVSMGCFPMIYVPFKERWKGTLNRSRREKQRSLRKSMRSARVLDLPVLTKAHADAGIRLDKVISGCPAAWRHDDVESVRSLLFADLDQESTIVSLIEDRGMITADHVIKALSEMESNGKPLQRGWL